MRTIKCKPTWAAMWMGALMLAGAGVYAAETGWTENLEAAKQQAAKEGKDLLMDFTGSDWCGYCIKLDKEVFSTDEFKKAAPKNFILVKLDFPNDRSKMSKETQVQNARLRKEYGVSGYPTIYLADATGVPYGVLGGYGGEGAAKWLESLAAQQKKKAQKEEGWKKANDPALAGIAKAKALDVFLSGLDEEIAKNFHGKTIDQIIELDAKNEAGLKVKYELAKRLDDARNTMQEEKFDQAMEQLDKILSDLKPKGEKAQEIYLTKAELSFRLKNSEGELKNLKLALDAAPKSEMAEQIKMLLKRAETKAEEAKKAGAKTEKPAKQPEKPGKMEK
ncbi:MAG: thioredoxin family protein [Candidatus Sumerlaeota bacterium]|nr:thioredoxin family protein [Candidatus Sumerlaeota bacterium]